MSRVKRGLSRHLVLAGGLAVGLTGCGEPEHSRDDRYVTTGSTDGLAFVASLESETPILEHVALKNISRQLGSPSGSLLLEGLLKVAREARFDDLAEVQWIRTSAGPGPGMWTGLAFSVVDRRSGRDLEWWGKVSRRDGEVVVEQVMGGGHGAK